jgi:biofilm PGA synthesis N-glycosyltransferase PgaC
MNSAEVILLFFSILAFGVFVLSVLAASTQLREPELSNSRGVVSLSLLLPVRNEPPPILNALEEQISAFKSEASTEIIIIDNGSERPVAFKHMPLNSSVLRMEPSDKGSKKQALTQGIEMAQFDWIVTTDADTRWSADWINAIRKQALPGKSMLIGPVFSLENNSFFSLLSYYESLCLWTITSASCGMGIPILASGANLAFKKTSWQAVNGYDSHIHRASGDDVLLMSEMDAKFPKELAVLKGRNAFTTTVSENKLSSWLSQRRRWISKTEHLNSPLKKGYSLVLFIWLIAPFFLGVVHLLLPLLWFLIEYLWIFRLTQWYRLNSHPLRWLLFRSVYPLTLPLILFSSSKAWK